MADEHEHEHDPYEAERDAGASGEDRDLFDDPYLVSRSSQEPTSTSRRPAERVPRRNPADLDDRPTPPSADRDTFVSRGFLPWIAVAVAVLVVGAIVMAKRIDPDAAGSAAEVARPSAQVTIDGPAVGSAGADEPARTPNPCPGYTLGTNVFTRPLAADQPGVHIWHDIEGFHVLLVPGAESVDQIDGTITATGVPLLLDPGSTAAAQRGDVITFSLDGAAPELRFKRDCGTTGITFDLRSGGQSISPDMITLGTGQKPDAVPVVVTQLEP